ncbi:MAG: DUF4129 domain-containing protein [Anaerolineales bacterium]|nr:DUF4129 domain-containing protein [Anaerolineales bacterium]
MRLTVDRQSLNPRYELLMQVWGHVQHELLYLSWALADVALLTPFALSVMGWARYWQPGVVLIWLLALMLLAFNLTRLMSVIALPTQYQQAITAVALLLVVVVTLPTFFHAGRPIFRFAWVSDIFAAINEPGNNLWLRDVILLILLILVWVRGLQLGQRPYSVERAGLRLRVGGMILAPMVIWMANTRLLWSSAPYILLFFLAGLTGLALIRAQEIEQNQETSVLALHPRWLTAVFLASLLIIFTAGTAAAIISGEAANGLIGWLDPVWQGLRLTGAVALTTFLYLLVPVFALMGWISGLLIKIWQAVGPGVTAWWAYLGKVVGKLFINQRVPDLPPDGQFGPDPAVTIDEIEQLTVQISRNGQIIIVLLVIAVILLVALLVTRLYQETTFATRSSGRLPNHTHEEDEEGNLLQQLLGKLGLWRGWQTAVTIRRIYRNMLRAADASGYPRLETETPYEFLKTLAKAWPDHQPETQLITNAYIKVRYGELPETKAEIQAIRQAWQTLEKAPPTQQLDTAG